MACQSSSPGCARRCGCVAQRTPCRQCAVLTHRACSASSGNTDPVCWLLVAVLSCRHPAHHHPVAGLAGSAGACARDSAPDGAGAADMQGSVSGLATAVNMPSQAPGVLLGRSPRRPSHLQPSGTPAPPVQHGAPVGETGAAAALPANQVLEQAPAHSAFAPSSAQLGPARQERTTAAPPTNQA